MAAQSERALGGVLGLPASYPLIASRMATRAMTIGCTVFVPVGNRAATVRERHNRQRKFALGHAKCGERERAAGMEYDSIPTATAGNLGLLRHYIRRQRA